MPVILARWPSYCVPLASTPGPAKYPEIETIRGLGLGLISGDNVDDAKESLASILADNDRIICCTGFSSIEGVQQIGVDYDVIGRGSPQDLFDKQLNVRGLLRSQDETRYFHQLLLRAILGHGRLGEIDRLRIRRLGKSGHGPNTGCSWMHRGRKSGGRRERRAFFRSGDYTGEAIESAMKMSSSMVGFWVQKLIDREVRPVEGAWAALAENPDPGLLKFQAVCGRGSGVAWDMDSPITPVHSSSNRSHRFDFSRSPLPMAVFIELAKFPHDTVVIQSLFSDYAASLGIDLTFQAFDDELNSLPGKYDVSQGGALLVARAQSSDTATLNHPDHTESGSLAAPQQNVVVGCVGLRRSNEHWCEMKRLYVNPEARGLRVGDRLVEAVIAQAQALGYRGIRLDTLPDMVAAQRLYRRHGFVEIEPYYDTPLKGTIFMGCDLTRY
ncbi:Acetyltransferase [Penicillium rolfsii]|nr:Acetyltransferase [Penicillium rolfsii]